MRRLISLEKINWSNNTPNNAGWSKFSRPDRTIRHWKYITNIVPNNCVSLWTVRFCNPIRALFNFWISDTSWIENILSIMYSAPSHSRGIGKLNSKHREKGHQVLYVREWLNPKISDSKNSNYVLVLKVPGVQLPSTIMKFVTERIWRMSKLEILLRWKLKFYFEKKN